MIKFLRMLERVYAAAAYAERGDWETAKSIANEQTGKRPPRDKHRAPARPRVHLST